MLQIFEHVSAVFIRWWSICCGVAVWGWRFHSQGGFWYEEKLRFCGGRTPVYCVLAVNFLLRGRALLQIRLYCFSTDLQGRNNDYHLDIFFLRHSWILWTGLFVIILFCLILYCPWIVKVFEMGGVPGWFTMTSLCRPTTSLRSSWSWWRILWYEAAVSPTTFRDLWKGAMEVSRECNAVNSLTDACFVQVLFYYT